MRTLPQLWPVAAVWLFMVLPYLAYSAPVLRRELDPLPWWLRAMLWSLEHSWPYGKIARFGRALDSWPFRSAFGPLHQRYHEEQLELPYE
jgi:hypothetical protein